MVASSLSVESAYLHGYSVRSQLQIFLPSYPPASTETLLWIPQVRIQDLLRQGELRASRQNISDGIESFEQERVRRSDGRAVLLR